MLVNFNADAGFDGVFEYTEMTLRTMSGDLGQFRQMFY